MPAGDTRRNQSATFFDQKDKKETPVLLQEREELTPTTLKQRDDKITK